MVNNIPLKTPEPVESGQKTTGDARRGRGRQRSSRTRFGGPRVPTSIKSFEGKSEGMKGHVFHCTGPGVVDQFTTSVKAMTDLIGLTLI